MRLGALIGSDAESPVNGFAIDHRKVAPGTVFGAFPGTRFNGEDFIPAAVAAGAVAVVSRPEAPAQGAVHVAADQRPEPHQCLVSPTSGSSSDVSMSRDSSGMTPSKAPVRAMTLATTGAAVKAAVVTPWLAAVGRGASIMTSTT